MTTTENGPADQPSVFARRLPATTIRISRRRVTATTLRGWGVQFAWTAGRVLLMLFACGGIAGSPTTLALDGAPSTTVNDQSTATRSEPTILREIAYRGDDPRFAGCVLDLYLPVRTDPAAASTTTLVWFHGGGLRGGDKHFPNDLLNRGRAVAAVNYRLAPKVDVKTCIDDCAASVAWVAEHAADYGGSAAKIALSGHSAGGYLTLMLGLDDSYLAKHSVDAESLMALAPISGHTITHFTQRAAMGLSNTDVRVDTMAPLAFLNQKTPPMLLVTGDRELEMLGRYEENAYFARMMKVVGHNDVTLHELDGYDHGGVVDPAIGLVNRFLRRVETEAPVQATD